MHNTWGDFMATAIDGLIGFFELFEPYFDTIEANAYLFLLWTLAWLAVFATVAALIYKKCLCKRFDSQLKAKDEKIAEIQTEHERQLTDKDTKIAELQAEHERQLTDKDTKIAELQVEHVKQLTAKDNEISKIQSDLDASERALIRLTVNDALKKDYDELNAYAWLAASKVPPNGKNAKTISVHTQKKSETGSD